MKKFYISILFIPLLSSCTSTDVEDPMEEPAPVNEPPPPPPPQCVPWDDPVLPKCQDNPPPEMLPVLDVAPGESLTLSTDSGELTIAGAVRTTFPLTPDIDDVSHIVLRNFTLRENATLFIVGDKPAKLTINGDAMIAGKIIVEAASGVGCARISNGKNGMDATTSITSAAGGGGGGARGSTGYPGGTGYGNRTGGSGGSPRSGILVGGCPGGTGGDNPSVNGYQGGEGGRGGGAIRLMVRDKLQISGQVMANGKGGKPGNRRGGGGGGGSGGTVYLLARDVVLAGATPLCANGGGGGEAGMTDATGTAGSDGVCAPTRSRGGGGDLRAGNGGWGGYRNDPATPDNEHRGAAGGNGGRTPNTNIVGGGGGAGGTVGNIFIHAGNSLVEQPGTVVSPAFIRVQ